jgi:sulfatase maturation enzyme AslB (radical SAM superfamily)
MGDTSNHKIPFVLEPEPTTPEPATVQNIFGSPKILSHEDRLGPYLDQWVSQGHPAVGSVPVTMELDLTNVCSHACPLCVGCRKPESQGETLFSVEGDGEQITTERAADYILQMAAAGVRGLIFTGGGEPTIHPDLVPLAAGAVQRGMQIGLITHGGLLHKHDMRALVEICTWIRISVDAANAREFADVHGRGEAEWNRLWQNIECLVKARRAFTAVSGAPGATIGLAFLTGHHNSESIVPFARRARDYGADYAQMRPFHRFIGFNPTQQLNEAQRLFDGPNFKVVGSVQKYSIIGSDRQILPRSYSYCHSAHFASVICANEKMYACCHYRNQVQYCIGDLRTHSFRDILHGSRRTEVMRRIRVDGCLPACRGDHVNRQVQQVLNGETSGKLDGAVPAHANFL